MGFDQRSKFVGEIINTINCSVALDIYAIQEKIGPAGW